MNIQDYGCVIVGSGFFGVTVAERMANDLNQPVLVVDQRGDRADREGIE